MQLTAEECSFLQIAVMAMLETLNKPDEVVWNAAALAEMEKMKAAGMTLKAKLQAEGLEMADMPNYSETDLETFTNQN